jgi:DNA polymerase III subunit delta'
MRTVVGHRQVRSLLERAALSGQVSHAYLLSGPSGIGKTTLAREFAALLECTGREPRSPEPCGACASCLKIARGAHPDVALVEPPAGKRFLDVDTVREVLHAANLAPSEGDYRIFILPEVERLLLPAVNALLKTLEEPPPHVVLLLTSAEPEQLLPTLLSRCQLLPLHPLAPDEITSALSERWGADAATAPDLAALANGRLGWAVRALEQPELRMQRAELLASLAELTGMPRAERIRQAGTLASDAEAVRQTLELWTLWWRDVVLAACGATNLATTGAARTEAERQGRALGRERTQAFLQGLLDARAVLDQNANTRLTLEVLMLDLPHLPAARVR